MNRKELDRRFTYHPPVGNQQGRYVEIRDTAKNFAEVIMNLCPESRESALAFTALEEAVFWANASIARNPYKEENSKKTDLNEFICAKCFRAEGLCVCPDGITDTVKRYTDVAPCIECGKGLSVVELDSGMTICAACYKKPPLTTA